MIFTLKSTPNGEFLAKNSNDHGRYIIPNKICLSDLNYSFDLEITLWINLNPKIESKLLNFGFRLIHKVISKSKE